jgi:hypothetical protein
MEAPTRSRSRAKAGTPNITDRACLRLSSKEMKDLREMAAHERRSMSFLLRDMVVDKLKAFKARLSGNGNVNAGVR